MRTNNREVHYMEPGTVAAKSILTGMLIGGAIGAVTMMLFAPRSGEETRAQIRNKAIELRDRTTDTVKDTVSQAKSKASEIRDTISETAGNLKDRGKHIASEQLDWVSDTANTGKKKVEQY